MGGKPLKSNANRGFVSYRVCMSYVEDVTKAEGLWRGEKFLKLEASFRGFCHLVLPDHWEYFSLRRGRNQSQKL